MEKRIKVHGTRDGKLFILPSDLLQLPSVIETINKAAKVKARPCERCPATKELTPDVVDELGQSKEEAISRLYVCGWNTKCYCRGYMNLFKITAGDL